MSKGAFHWRCMFPCGGHTTKAEVDFQNAYLMLFERLILHRKTVGYKVLLKNTRQSLCEQGRPSLKSTTVCLLVGYLTSKQQASVSQVRICSDKFTCCHTKTEAADQTFYIIQSQYTDTGQTSSSADPITPGSWWVTGMTWPSKISASQAGIKPRIFRSWGGRFN